MTRVAVSWENSVRTIDFVPRPAMLEIRKKGGDPMTNSEISEVAEA
jgi:hypothetical protein